jgi:hypothetical protein
MGLSLEDAMEQEGSWDSFLMHHSGWFVQDEPGELADWGSLHEAEADDTIELQLEVQLNDSDGLGGESYDDSVAHHTSDDEDGPFYPDEFILSFDE